MKLRFLVFYVFGIVVFVRALTEPCSDGQFKPNYIDGCVDCPENPETNCEAEGDDSESCKTSCIKDTSEEKSNKKTIVLGVTLAVVGLIIVIGLGFLGWHLKKKNNETSLNGSNNPVENVHEEANSLDVRVRSVVNGNEDNYSNPPSSPGPESPIYPGLETAFDLDIRKDPSASVYLSSSDITHN